MSELKRKKPYSIRRVILFSFTIVAALIIVALGVSFSNVFSRHQRNELIENTQSIANQEVLNIESYLASLRNISNALYYDVIKQADITNMQLAEEINLLYAANSNQIVSIALFDEDGNVVNAAPSAPLKPLVDVKEQEWFSNALSKVENVHFSSPHVQNIFVSPTYQYHWVISLSVAVDMVNNGNIGTGVLLIDMNYQNLEQMLEDSNEQLSNRYSYLVNNDGEMIYHPLLNQIQNNQDSESVEKLIKYRDGVHNQNGDVVIVNTIAYTGWKLVSIIPAKTLAMGEKSLRTIMIVILILTEAMMIIINRLVANRVSEPLIRLTDSIANMEGVKNIPEDIYVTSSKEVRELGTTLHSYMSQINRYVEEIRKEENLKRKSELDALQAQINPHFLYNTLDSIVWMIEGEKHDEAVYMITQLASFFRMSLNRGKSMISLENEIKQAKAYLAIQKIRYKQAFVDIFEIDPAVEDALIVKLVIQPVLENAIYHGIKEAEQDGRITIKAYKDGEDVVVKIQDNGYGMSKEELEQLFVEDKKSTADKHGSGVGLINVDKRIKLRFGIEYGLLVESEMDVGTCVTIRFPYISFTEENAKKYEDKEEEMQ